MLIIMVVAVIGIGTIMKISQVFYDNSQKINNNISTSEQTKMAQKQQDSILTDLKSRLDTAKDDVTKPQLQVEYDIKKAAVDKGIDLNSSGFRARAIYSAVSLKIENMQLKLQNNNYDKTVYDLNEKLSNEYYNEAINNDFKAYISTDNENINSSTQMTSIDKQVNLYVNDLLIKYNVTGTNTSMGNMSLDKYSYVSTISNEKRSLITGIDYTSMNNTPLSPEIRSKITDQLALNVYQLENFNPITSTNPINKDLSTSAMGGVGIIVLIILMIILGGATISQEISTGSIKSLIISPTKRWKMIVAKFIALLSIAFVFYLLLYVVTMVTSGFLFGFSGDPYIYVTNGIANGMNFYIYQFLYGLLSFIAVVIYLILAIMLSTVTRNTAASVGISIGLYFVGGIVVTALTALSSILKGEWIKFVPFENFSVADKIFPSQSVLTAQAGAISSVPPIALSFSICYIVVIIALMFYTTLDSFCRREIK